MQTACQCRLGGLQQISQLPLPIGRGAGQLIQDRQMPAIRPLAGLLDQPCQIGTLRFFRKFLLPLLQPGVETVANRGQLGQFVVEKGQCRLLFFLFAFQGPLFLFEFFPVFFRQVLAAKLFEESLQVAGRFGSGGGGFLSVGRPVLQALDGKIAERGNLSQGHKAKRGPTRLAMGANLLARAEKPQLASSGIFVK